MLKEAIKLIRTATFKGALRLKNHSRIVGSVVRNHALMNILEAFEKCGILSRFVSQEGISPEKEPGFNSYVLRTVCEYLYEIGILEQSGSNIYRAKNPVRFKRLMKAVNAAMAYNPPLQDLDNLLTGKHEYGRDVCRDDRYDAIASDDVSEIFYYGFTEQGLRKTGTRVLLDVGCGTGAFLAFLDKRESYGKLYGIDLSESAIKEGKARGYESGRVKLVTGSALKPDDLRVPGMETPDTLLIMQVLHEFTDPEVARILKSIRAGFPGARVFITETPQRNTQAVKKRRTTSIPELKLVHLLSNQVMRTSERWMQLFSDAGYELVDSEMNDLANVMYLVFEPILQKPLFWEVHL